MDDKNTALIIGMIAKIASDNSFNKALNMVLLKELSIVTKSDFKELIESAKQMQEENQVVTHETFNDLVDQVYGREKPAYVEDYLK